MGALTILRRCRGAKEEMERIQRRVARRRDAMTSITQAPSEGGGGGSDDRYASFVSAIDEYESLLKRRDACYRAELSASCALLEELPETESAVLYDYYVQVEKVDAIARKMRYSESYVRRVKACGEQRVRGIDESRVRAALPDWYLLQEREAAGA